METRPGILGGEYSSRDDDREESLRPTRLLEFQGQSRLKENLEIFLRAARQRGECLDHIFLAGPPGLGKTTLAGIMAQEMGAEFRVTSAPALEKPKDLVGIITTITEGTVFFIDEIHRLRPVLEEMLYIAMEDFEVDWVIGQGPSARTIRIPIPQFTLVGATTKTGQLTGPLHSRFGISVRMELYSPEELRRIISRSARIMGTSITPEAEVVLSNCSRGTPRVANRLLRRIRDFAEVLGDGAISEEIVSEGLKRLDIDQYGLEKLDRQLLRVIAERYNGGPVGAETLAITLGEGVESLEDFYEPYLIQRGLLQRTPRGRMITSEGWSYLGLTAPNTSKGDGSASQRSFLQ